MNFAISITFFLYKRSNPDKSINASSTEYTSTIGENSLKISITLWEIIELVDFNEAMLEAKGKEKAAAKKTTRRSRKKAAAPAAPAAEAAPAPAAPAAEAEAPKTEE